MIEDDRKGAYRDIWKVRAEIEYVVISLKLLNNIQESEIGDKWDNAGSNVVIDGPALEIIKNKKIPTCVINGGKLVQIKKAIIDEPFEGTRIIL